MEKERKYYTNEEFFYCNLVLGGCYSWICGRKPALA